MASAGQDDGVSEVLAKVLLVGMTVTLLGGFSALVITTVARDTPAAPVASFTMEPTASATSVDVRLLSGASLRLAETTLILTVDGASTATSYDVLSPTTPGVWAQGETLRVLLSGALAPDADLRFFAADLTSGKSVGTAYATVPSSTSGTPILQNALTASLAFDRSPLIADGVTTVNATVQVTSTHGLLLVDHVSVNLSPVGGASDLRLYDDGVSPDDIAADGIFSASFLVGNHTFAQLPGFDNVTLRADVLDVLGRTTSTTTALFLASPTPSKAGAGIAYRNIGSSAVIGTAGFINLTSFAFRDASALDSDQVELRVSDLVDSTKVWSALVSFATTGCASSSITSVVLRIDGVSGNVTYTPSGGCFSLGASTKLNLANVTDSRDASGATATWSTTGTAASYQYAVAGVGASNEALIAFFGDTQSSSPFALGLSQTDFSWAPPFTTGVASAPAAIADLAGTPGNGYVDLAWSAPSNGGSAITAYRIYRNGSFLAEIGTNTSFRASGLLNGVSYTFTVRAVNAVGEGPASNEAVATPVTTPDAPTGLSAVKGNGLVSLSWSAPAQNGGSAITNYHVYVGTTSGAATYRASTGGANTSFVVNGLTNGQTYFFNVTAQNAVGQGASSAETSAVPSTVPGASSLAATAGNGQVTLTWSLGSDGGSALTDQHIYRGLSSGATTLLASTGNGANTSFVDTTALNGVTYYYNVTARNANGVGPSSNEVSATPALGNTVPTAPQSLTATRGNKSVALSWSAPSSDGGSAITNYRIYSGTTSGATTYIAATGGTNTTFTVNSLANGVETFFNVTAVNAVGEGPSSLEASAVPAGVPYPPTGISATRGNQSASLAWVAPADTGGVPITTYHIYRGTSSGSAVWIASTGGANTSFVANGLTNGQPYFFNVTAAGSAGQGSSSPEVSVTPATLPNPPGSLGGTAGDQEVALTWTIPSNGGSAITTFRIYRGTSSGAASFLASTGSGANTSFVARGLTNGQPYFFNVTAVNDVGESATSAEVTATPAGVPSAPQGVGAVKGNALVTLSWSAPASNGGSPVTTYHIYRGTSTGSTTWLATTGGTNTSFVVNGLTNGQVYFFNVTAANAVGQGASSAEVSATPSTVPQPPEGVAATAGNGAVTLTWSAPTSNGGSAILQYDIYRGTSSGAATFYASAGSSNTSFIVSPLTNGQPYFFNLTAVNANGPSASSAEVSATPSTTPGAPTGLAGTSGNGTVALSWNAPGSNGGSPITNYYVYRGTSSGATSFLAATGGTNTSFVAAGLTNGQPYFFNVTAVNANGQGASSAEATSTPASVPNPPASLSVSTATASQLDLSWSAGSNGGSAITAYQVWRGGASGTETLLATIGTNTSYIDLAVTVGNTYYYQIRAVNAVGTSSPSNEVSGLVAGSGTLAGAPTGLTATPANNQVALTWTAPGSSGSSPLTSYRIYRGGSSGSLSLLASLGTNTSFTDRTALNNATYYYAVSAVTDVGEGPRSAEASATPSANIDIDCSSFSASAGTLPEGCLSLKFGGTWGNLTETGAGGPNKEAILGFTMNVTGVTGTQTLEIRGQRNNGPENLLVQAWDPSTSNYVTIVTLPSTATSMATYTGSINMATYASNGLLTLRVRDAGADSNSSSWIVDFVRLVTT